jgi:hypothetical protein
MEHPANRWRTPCGRCARIAREIFAHSIRELFAGVYAPLEEQSEYFIPEAVYVTECFDYHQYVYAVMREINWS